MEVQKKPHLHRDWVDRSAFEIVKSLRDEGFETYLVGGCVRDLLVGQHPKDFDIATMAHPEQVRRFISRAYVIGRRFRLVLVRRGETQFEVATFRRDYDPNEFPDGPPPGDNIFGTPEEDARRRDFTVNALFYDPLEDRVIDYVGGLDDIERRTLRMIGTPEQRLSEDPIRILRALRLAHKLRFTLNEDLRAAMVARAAELKLSVLPRRREEYLKILKLQDPDLTLLEAFDLGLLDQTVPALAEIYRDPNKCELFTSYLHRIPSLSRMPESSTELFGLFLLAFVRTEIEPDPHKPLRADTLLKDPKMNDLMRDQLGMFKLEQSVTAKALQLQSLIARTEEFMRKGPKRQSALLRNEAFPLALLMAEMDLVTDPSSLHFWRKQVTALVAEMPARAPRRRPRRRRPKPMP